MELLQLLIKEKKVSVRIETFNLHNSHLIC